MVTSVQAGLPIETQHSLSENINDKISRIYAYTATAMAATLASALLSAKWGLSVAVLSIVRHGPLGPLGIFAIGASLIFATHVTHKNSPLKLGMFGLFAVWQGIFLSPLYLMNAAAFVTATGGSLLLVGGLGALSMVLKDSFVRYEKILMVALGALSILSLGSICLTGAAAAFADKICYIGGFALFSTLVIYDTHEAREKALDSSFDEINQALGIYLNAINLLIRIFRHLVTE